MSKEIERIEKFFKKNKISGIVNIPDIGTFTIFNSIPDKLMVLDHAKVELMARDNIIQMEALQKAEKVKDGSSTERPKYVG